MSDFPHSRRADIRPNDPFADPLDAVLAEIAVNIQLPPGLQAKAVDRYEAVRRYIERAHSIRAPEQTTEEFLLAAARNPSLRIMFITGFAAVALAAGEKAPAGAKVLSKPIHLPVNSCTEKGVCSMVLNSYFYCIRPGMEVAVRRIESNYTCIIGRRNKFICPDIRCGGIAVFSIYICCDFRTRSCFAIQVKVAHVQVCV